MKSCPKCNRTFPDENQKFCTFDGGLLVVPRAFDPNATIRATAADLEPESSTQSENSTSTSRDLPDPNATVAESYAATIALPRNTGPTGGAPITSDFSAAPRFPQPENQSLSATLSSPKPSAPIPVAEGSTPTVRKRSKLPWIIGGLLLLLALGGGAAAGLFFVVVKPWLEHRTERATTVGNSRTVSEANSKEPAAAPSEQPSVTPEDSFVPPPGAVQFVNSKDRLAGKLAEHYFDFSFYYPKAWTRDPKAGTPGANNFVSVVRSLPPDFPQETFSVGWYTSTGTFTGDSASFSKRVEEFSSALAKQFPEYRKVSEGPTKINSMQGYEFRWEGRSRATAKGDLNLWGRVVFLPTGQEGDTAGATLTMFSTSLANELSGVDDVGEKGQMPVILESFRFGSQK